MPRPRNYALKPDPATGLSEAALRDANRAYDLKHGFQFRRPLEVSEDDFTRSALEYPPYVPAIPGFDKNATTEEEIRDWHIRWMKGRPAGG